MVIKKTTRKAAPTIRKIVSSDRKRNARGPSKDTHITAQASRNLADRGIIKSSGKVGGQYSQSNSSEFHLPSGRPNRRIVGGEASPARRSDRITSQRQKYNRMTYGPVDVSEPSNYGAPRRSLGKLK